MINSRVGLTKNVESLGAELPDCPAFRNAPLLTASEAAGGADGNADAGISPSDEPVPPEVPDEPLPRGLPAEEEDPFIPVAAVPAQPSCVYRSPHVVAAPHKLGHLLE